MIQNKSFPLSNVAQVHTEKKLELDTEGAVLSFVQWLDKHGYEGYDLYDLWATEYGKWSKDIYYKNKKLGLPLVAPIFLADLFWPGIRKYVAVKRRYATTDAHFILAFLERHKLTGEDIWLNKAAELAVVLESYAIKGFSGLCWGYPFDWQTNRGLWPEGTPYITVTPYAYHAFAALADVTGKQSYNDTAMSIARFAQKDLNKTRLSNGTIAASYSPIDNTSVVNANAYRAGMLVEAGIRFSAQEFIAEAEESIQFILSAQRDDGSWLYDVQNPRDKFVDNFHSCMVMKNLVLINNFLNRTDIEEALTAGYNYYLQNLIDSENNPIPFAQIERFPFVKQEMYDYAEGLNLGILMKDRNLQALPLAMHLASRLINDYQTSSGHFITRELMLGRKMSYPFIRWTQAQVFTSLCRLQNALLRINDEK